MPNVMAALSNFNGQEGSKSFCINVPYSVASGLTIAMIWHLNSFQNGSHLPSWILKMTF